MSNVITARGVTRRFGRISAVDDVDLEVGSGSILGLIGRNGAGKTTLLRSLLGLTACKGHIEVLGACPRRERAQLMRQVCFIADTATLPRWMRVDQLLDYVEGVHPGFDRQRAEGFLAATEVTQRRIVRQLSKGMTVQLHLALVLAIDARLLVLDEPTLGLDILSRKRFYETLMNEYFDEQRTIIISTHQVEEVEQILTHLAFMQHGKLVMQQSMSEVERDYVELHAVGDQLVRAESIPHLGARAIPGGKALIFNGVPPDSLSPLGELRTPSVADLFLAQMEELD